MNSVFRSSSLGGAALGALVLVSASGCGFTAGKVTSARIIGSVSPVTGGGYSFKDFTDIDPDGFPLALDEPMTTTGEWMVLRIVQDIPFGSPAEFDIIFGPDPATGGTAEAEVKTADGFFLSAGWALLDGRCPIANTPRTWTGSDGTRLLVHIYESPPAAPLDRVYLLKLTSPAGIAVPATTTVHVRPCSSGTTRYLTAISEYVSNSSSTGPVSAVYTLSASLGGLPNPLQAFVDRCLAIATEVGWLP